MKQKKPTGREQRQQKTRPEGEWITVEEFDESGQRIVPRKVLAATVSTRYDPKKHTDLHLRLVTGPAPAGTLIGQYKVYEIHSFDMKGWKRRAEAVLNLGPYRYYEEKWFDAYEGSKVTVSDPGLPGSISTDYEMIVERTTFGKKEISRASTKGGITTDPVYEASLRMRETVRSTLRRYRGRVIKFLVLTVVGALLAALVGLML